MAKPKHAPSPQDKLVTQRLGWLIALTLVLSVAAVMAWRIQSTDPMQDYRGFPNTYITEADMGYDADKVIIGPGLAPTPSISTPGGTAWEAYIHPDPAVVPLRDGKPCIIPRITVGENAFRTPPGACIETAVERGRDHGYGQVPYVGGRALAPAVP